MAATWIGLAFGVVNYVCGLPAYMLEERVGRSILLLLGLPNMAWLMLILSLCFLIHSGSPARNPVIGIFLVLFTIVYSPTAGPSPFAISSEASSCRHL